MTHSKALKVILALSFALKLIVTSPAQASEPASPQGAAEFVNMLSARVAAIWALKMKTYLKQNESYCAI